MTDKKYQVLLADPPWHYHNYGAEPGTTHNRARGAQKHYPTMTHDSLCAMPIGDISDDRSVLFMWAVWPMIDEAIEVIKAWGFTYKTLAWEWIKMNPNNMGIFVGMGNFTRSNPEPCLLAFKGKPIPVSSHSISSVIMAPIQEHSRKPQIQYDNIDALYLGLSKIELFARKQRPGWDVFGNEVENSISLEE